MLEELWKKHQAETLTIKTSTEKAFAAVQADTTGAAAKVLLDAQALVEGSKNSQETTQVFAEMAQKLAENPVLSPDQKELATQLLQAQIFTQHGVQREEGTIRAIKEEVISKDSHLLKVDDYFNMPLMRSPSFSYVITGRIDCLELLPTGERRIYEVKNRTKRLFRKLYDSERIQVLTYMALTGHTGPSPALLVEQFNDERFMLEVPWDEAYFNGVIDQLLDFTKRLDRILTDEEARREYIAKKTS